jgi:PIN domain nuclease of toxin-antitoxin system
LLLDTHVLVWALTDDSRLSRTARELLADASHEAWVSAASVWEIAIKSQLARPAFPFRIDDLERAVDSSGFRTLDVGIRHALATARVATPHADPFDRLLLAQCEVETMRLLTADRELARLPATLAC